MDKVTDVQRKDGVAKVRLLSGDTLHVPSPLFLERKLYPGELIDPAAYRQFMLERGYSHALEAAMKYLSLRERSEKEVRSRLRRSCYEEAVIEKVLSSLRLHHLLSDARFAEAWTHSRARKYGKNRIAQELRIKGIPGDDARNALSQISDEDEVAQALAQAQKLARRTDDTQKILHTLIRRGYRYAIAKRALAALFRPTEEE